VLSKTHSKLGTAGFVISIVALVAALGGGAYAASGGLSGKQKKEVEKIAKKFSGKSGATGAVGPAGSKGDAGGAGPAGATGATGATGPAGAPGVAGTNGKNGTTGFTEVLPPGATETGTVVVSQSSSGSHNAQESISFPIPLEEEGKSPLEENGVPKAGAEGSAFIFSPSEINAEETGKVVNTEPTGEKFVQEKGCKPGPTAPNCLETGCVGSAAEPTAPPGVLCVYLAQEERTKVQGEPYLQNLNSFSSAYGATGAVLTNYGLNGEEGEPASISAYGGWAVTAPE
jgi:Collagen triple helix repeat (20 copies)